MGIGAVQSLARPGGNVTGTTNSPIAGTTAITTKGLDLLKQLVPGLVRVGYLIDQSLPSYQADFPYTESAAADAGAQLLPINVHGTEDEQVQALDIAIQSANGWAAGALYVAESVGGSQSLPHVIELAAHHRLPAIFQNRNAVEAGGLISYGYAAEEPFRRAAYYVDRILRGANPTDLPVEQPTRFDLAINLRTAETLGLTIPPDVAAQVTYWIQ